ncbi:coadhesin-like isoform X3 [Orbicella faveolata]|uniref:coadhesin-like isoform X3 n=1 Tax=Orbicella faveolata TaxID=48498 RepID=UPI0009E358F7|nr:coadhesin-like isoform X3 [Orbicella faveolata]
MIKLNLIVIVCAMGYANSADPPFKTCKRTWRKVGCFKDLKGGQRALKEQLVNIRDPKSKVFPVGEPKLSWKHLTQSFHSLACLCAEKARKKGYGVFGLQFYGECWGQVNGTETYSMFGAAKHTSCVMDYAYTDNKISGLKHCDILSEQECVGVHSTNYVYRLDEDPGSPGDGGWSEWGEWSKCDKWCGTGKKSRERTCTNPPPENGGKGCEGPHKETVSCKRIDCPIDGGFTPWKPVSECSKTCGGGTQKFVRHCTNPPPQFGGKDCVGPKEKVELCNDFECPIPCVKAIDLGVILDATNSVGSFNFNLSKKFAIALVNSMTIAPGASHLALMVYNIHPTMLVSFNEADKQDPSVIKGILQGTQELKGKTFTDRAIKLAGEVMFTTAGGERPDKADVLIILTDGRTNENSEPYDVVNQPLRAKGVKIIAVGVGKRIFKEELKKIALGKEENVFQISDFDKLSKELLQPIIDMSCPAGH